MTVYELLLIGGGAGAGKTTVAREVSAALRRADTAHCLIEGDYMDSVHPAPAGDPHRAAITERNIATVRSNYAALGQRRLVYFAVMWAGSMAWGRATGLDHLRPAHGCRSHSAPAARPARGRVGTRRTPGTKPADASPPGRGSPAGTFRIPTDDRSVSDIATHVIRAATW